MCLIFKNPVGKISKKNGAWEEDEGEIPLKNLVSLEKFHFSKLLGSDTSYACIESSDHAESKYVVIVFCRVRRVGEFVGGNSDFLPFFSF